MKRQDASQNADLSNKESQYLKTYKSSIDRWINILSTTQRNYVAEAPTMQFDTSEASESERSVRYVAQQV